jgi:hypothetical protein
MDSRAIPAWARAVLAAPDGTPGGVAPVSSADGVRLP